MICLFGFCIPAAAIWPLVFMLVRPVVAWLRANTPLAPYLPDLEGKGTASASGSSLCCGQKGKENGSGQPEDDVIDVRSADHLDELLGRKDGERPSTSCVVIQFTAAWCGPCRRVSPTYAKLAGQCRESGRDVTFVRIDIDELSELAVQYGVTSIPAFHAYKEGKILDRYKGANSQGLEAFCLKHFTPLTAAAAADDKLKSQ